MEGDNRKERGKHDFSVLEASSMFMFPGFKFSPSDQELIQYYLNKKMEGCEKSVEVVAEVDICSHEPWDLPAKSVIYSDKEWFFSARGKKHPCGSKNRRTTELGYWKVTGREHEVKSGTDIIGTKRTLVFHLGRAPKGTRTGWMMNEYSANVEDQNSFVVCRLRKSPLSCKHETPDKTSLSQRPLPANIGNVASVALDQFAVAEAQSKKCSSSYDSHSVGQIDSDAESKSKPKLSKAESSTCQKDRSSSSEGEIKSRELVEAILPSVLPVHGIANRRIRLRKQMPRNTKASALQIWRMSKKLNTQNRARQQGPEKSLTHLIRQLLGLRINPPLIRLVDMMLFVLILLLFPAFLLLGGFQKVKTNKDAL